MKYTVTEVDSGQESGLTVVSFELSARDWYALENSRQWSALGEFLDGLQTPNNR